MNLFAITTLLTSIASFLLGLFVLKRKAKSSLNRNWSLVCFFMGIWSLGFWGVITAPDAITALYFQYILDIGAIFIPIFYFKFILILLNLKKEKRAMQVGLYVFSFVLAFFSYSPLFKVGMKTYTFGFNYWIDPGPLYLIFPTYFALLMFYCFYLLYSNLNKATGITKNQIKYILAAGIVGFVGGSTNFFPQIFNFYPIGNYFVVLYIFFVAYAIIKYRLMGIRLLMSKFYIYTIVAGFAFALFHFVYIINENLMGGVYSATGLTFGWIVALIFAIILFPFLNYIQKSSDTLFFKGYNPRAIIKDLTIKFSSVIEINALLKILNDEFKKILTTEEVGVIIFKKNGNSGRKSGKESFLISHASLNWANLKANNKICQEAVKKKMVIIRSEIKAKIKDEPNAALLIQGMDENNVEVIAPLIIAGRVTGLIVLGEKISQEGYTQEDIEFLEIISSQAAVAIENALLYKEIGEMNKNLQKKVEEKTGELREKNEYLEKLLVMRSEFLDIASHQLRTPVSVIKGMSSMIIEGGLGPDKVNEFLRAILEKSNKLAEIINDILRASEMDSEKVLLKFSQVDINKFLMKLIEDKKIQSKAKNITLTLALPEKPLPTITADDRYLEQAIGNLVNNSFQYTPVNGKVEVIARLKGKKIEIRVKDNGIGIPKDDLPKLFSKFSRAKNAIAMYTDGTGLGLFIVKKIIEEHKGGNVCIEKTEEGKGTTLLITLGV